MNSELHYEITADNRIFIKQALETRKEIDRTVDMAKRSGKDLESMFSGLESGLKKLALAGASAFTMSKATQFSRDCIMVRANIQSIENAFTTLLKSETKAMNMLESIKNFAATTPMDLDVLARNAQTMLSFNIDEESVIPMLKRIGDISMADAQKFDSLTLAFSQMSSTGRLLGQDLNQMINAGFNPLAELSEKQDGGCQNSKLIWRPAGYLSRM